MDSGSVVSPASVGAIEANKPQVAAGNRSNPPVQAAAVEPPPQLQGNDDTLPSVPPPTVDAVTVDLSTNSNAASGSADSASQPAESNGSASQMSDEQAQQLAEQYQSVLNQTSVRFGVLVDRGGDKAISFQVIDETGKVVRQFPAEKMADMTAKVAAPSPKGALVDETS